MPGMPQARAGDLHVCAVPPGFPSPILPPCAVTVIVGKKPAARQFDIAMSGPVPPGVPPAPHPFAKGSMTVMICKMPALRVMDPCTLGGMVTLGEFTVLTGG